MSAEERFIKWKSESYPTYGEYPEFLRYETDRGELVRSKSELIIANLLYKEDSHLHYRYEEKLYLKQSNKTIHPDFTIMSRRNGEIVYWEHAGKMDDSRYADDFTRKINAYIKEGIFPGKNLIITYETGTVPLEVSVVKKLIKNYFFEDFLVHTSL